MAVRTVPAVAVFAVAAAVFVVVRERRLCERLARERAVSRLMAGRLQGDLDAFRVRLAAAVAESAVPPVGSPGAGGEPCEALDVPDLMNLPMEGGPR